MEDSCELKFCVDSITQELKYGELKVIGWAVDTNLETVPDINIEDKENNLISSSIELVHREDINRIFLLKPYALFGFVITLTPKNFLGVVVIDFQSNGQLESFVLDLSKDYLKKKENFSKTKLIKAHIKLTKGLRYIKRNGLLNTFRRLQIDRMKSNDKYLTWIEQNENNSLNHSQSEFLYNPLISVLIPVYNVEEKYLRKCIDSVLTQSYQNWELCICDDASTMSYIKPLLKHIEEQDSRIHVAFHETNEHICGASNTALSIANGEFVALLDDDDVLPKNALHEVVKQLNELPNLDLIYTDEDKIDEDGNRSDPAFKPEWSPDLFLSTNYISHFCVLRKEIVNRIGGFRKGYEGSQDYDLLLRFTEKTIRKNIKRISKVLYHWRMLPSSTSLSQSSKNYAYDSGKKALEDTLIRRNIKGSVSNGEANGFYDVKYDVLNEELVSIIIPTKNNYEDLKKCIDSIIEQTRYLNFEIIVADNGSDDSKLASLYSKYSIQLKSKFILFDCPIPFNYSKINNLASKKAHGKYLLFLNNDTQIISKNWITDMVSFSQFNRVGVVGAKLYYENNTIQHAGVVVGLGGLAGHVHHEFPKGDFGYFGKLIVNVNYLAVTAACLMVKKKDFDQVGGFDERLKVAYNDVDLCLKIYELEKDNVWLHNVELFHFESKSRGYETTPEKQRRFLEEAKYFEIKWKKYIKTDPYYNENLTKSSGDYSLNLK